jgi:class 3 adenylate cyclase
MQEPSADRRRVSVLFIDVVEFTSYAEGADPEQVRALQNDYFSAVRRVIGQYGGVVEKYIGDAAMALFGAPVATENDPLRCVRAALELQRVLPRQHRIDAAGLQFRVGIATGEALVDVSAARDGGQAIVAGDVVNSAARLQELASGGAIFICENTYTATRGDIEYVEQPPVVLRGRSRPSRMWLAVAARRARPGELAAEPTPMVDREHERGLLINALHRTVRNHTPQLVTIFGAAGIGKSRLLRELARHAATITDPPICWRVGHCPPFGENVTYAALADIVKAEATILDTDDEATARRRLDATLAELVADEDSARLAGALQPLVGLPGSGLSPGETEQCWRRFILAMASRQPTVLVFEDMHWADEPMLRFVEMLGASARGLPLLVLCTARPELRERHPSWTSTITGTVSISLPPLADSDIGTMYSLLFGAAASTPDALIELADGNPLYAQEYVRMLLDGGMRRTTSGAPSLEDLAAAAPMPENVQAVIANRLDLLDQADRAVLQAASVVGRQFWPGAVAFAANQPLSAAERALSRLEARDLVQELPSSTMAGQVEYRFRHILVRDVCYQRMPRAERVVRHQRTAEWLENASEGRQTDLGEVLAHHRWAAHEIARTLGLDLAPHAPAAREAMHRAARRAYALHALQTAAEWVERARNLDLPEDRTLELFAAELALFRDRDAFLDQGGVGRLGTLAAQLLDDGDPAGAARAWTLLGTTAWSRADLPGTLEHLGRAVRLYESLPDSADKAHALLELARVHMYNCEHEPAGVAAKAAGEIADRLGLMEVHGSAKVTLAASRYMAGDPDGFDQIAEAREHCRRHRLESQRRAINNLAWAVLEEGDVAACNRLIDEQNSLDIAGGHALSTSFADEAGRAFYAGNWAESMDAAEASMRLPTADWELHLVPQRGWLQVLRGEPVDDGAVDRAVAAAQRSGFHRVLLRTLAHAALCRVLQGRTEQAAALMDAVEEDWAGTGILPFAEFVAPLAYAGALMGVEGAARVRAMLKRSPRFTAWVDAAMGTLEGTLTSDPSAYHEAAEAYGRIGDLTDRALTLALAARGLVRQGHLEQASPLIAEVTAFARRNSAPRLLDGLPVSVDGEPAPG